MQDTAIHERASRAILLSYFCMGLPLGVTMPRMAEIKSAVGANAASFGAALALMSIGTLLGTWLASHAIHRLGSRLAAAGILPFAMIASASNGYLTSIAWFGFVTLAYGAASTAVFMALNSQSVLIEQHLRRSFMPKVLASWSVGSFSGSVISSWLAPHLSPAAALTTGASISLVAFLVSTRWLLPARLDDRPHEDPAQLPRHERIPRDIRNFLILIGIAQCLGLVAEMSVGDWGAVLLHEQFGVAVGPNGLGFAVFMFTMIVVRLTAARGIDHFGLERFIRGSALLGGLGFAALLTVANLFTVGSPTSSLIAMCIAYVFLCIGVGAMPAAFISAAGAIRGLPSARAIAFTTALVGLGNMILRTGFGVLAQWLSLRYALYAIPVLVITAGFMATLLRPARTDAYVVTRPTGEGQVAAASHR